MLRRAVRCGNRLNDWNTMPTLRRRAASSLALFCSLLFSTETVSVSSEIDPSEGVSWRLIQRRNVLLPAPLGPIMETTSPFITFRDTSSSTLCTPKYLVMRRAESCVSAERSGDSWLSTVSASMPGHQISARKSVQVCPGGAADVSTVPHRGLPSVVETLPRALW